MNTQALEQNRSIVQRYADHPDVLPAHVRDAMETAWEGQPVQLYALAVRRAGFGPTGP